MASAALTTGNNNLGDLFSDVKHQKEHQEGSCSARVALIAFAIIGAAAIAAGTYGLFGSNHVIFETMGQWGCIATLSAGGLIFIVTIALAAILRNDTISTLPKCKLVSSQRFKLVGPDVRTLKPGQYQLTKEGKLRFKTDEGEATFGSGPVFNAPTVQVRRDGLYYDDGFHEMKIFAKEGNEYTPEDTPILSVMSIQRHAFERLRFVEGSDLQNKRHFSVTEPTHNHIGHLIIKGISLPLHPKNSTSKLYEPQKTGEGQYNLHDEPFLIKKQNVWSLNQKLFFKYVQSSWEIKDLQQNTFANEHDFYLYLAQNEVNDLLDRDNCFGIVTINGVKRCFLLTKKDAILLDARVQRESVRTQNGTPLLKLADGQWVVVDPFLFHAPVKSSKKLQNLSRQFTTPPSSNGFQEVILEQESDRDYGIQWNDFMREAQHYPNAYAECQAPSPCLFIKKGERAEIINEAENAPTTPESTNTLYKDELGQIYYSFEDNGSISSIPFGKSSDNGVRINLDNIDEILIIHHTQRITRPTEEMRRRFPSQPHILSAARSEEIIKRIRMQGKEPRIGVAYTSDGHEFLYIVTEEEGGRILFAEVGAEHAQQSVWKDKKGNYRIDRHKLVSTTPDGEICAEIGLEYLFSPMYDGLSLAQAFTFYSIVPPPPFNLDDEPSPLELTTADYEALPALMGAFPSAEPLVLQRNLEEGVRAIQEVGTGPRVGQFMDFDQKMYFYYVNGQEVRIAPVGKEIFFSEQKGYLWREAVIASLPKSMTVQVEAGFGPLDAAVSSGDAPGLFTCYPLASQAKTPEPQVEQPGTWKTTIFPEFFSLEEALKTVYAEVECPSLGLFLVNNVRYFFVAQEGAGTHEREHQLYYTELKEEESESIYIEQNTILWGPTKIATLTENGTLSVAKSATIALQGIQERHEYAGIPLYTPAQEEPEMPNWQPLLFQGESEEATIGELLFQYERGLLNTSHVITLKTTDKGDIFAWIITNSEGETLLFLDEQELFDYDTSSGLLSHEGKEIAWYDPASERYLSTDETANQLQTISEDTDSFSCYNLTKTHEEYRNEWDVILQTLEASHLREGRVDPSQFHQIEEQLTAGGEKRQFGVVYTKGENPVFCAFIDLPGDIFVCTEITEESEWDYDPETNSLSFSGHPLSHNGEACSTTENAVREALKCEEHTYIRDICKERIDRAIDRWPTHATTFEGKTQDEVLSAIAAQRIAGTLPEQCIIPVIVEGSSKSAFLKENALFISRGSDEEGETFDFADERKAFILEEKPIFSPDDYEHIQLDDLIQTENERVATTLACVQERWPTSEVMIDAESTNDARDEIYKSMASGGVVGPCIIPIKIGETIHIGVLSEPTDDTIQKLAIVSLEDRMHYDESSETIFYTNEGQSVNALVMNEGYLKASLDFDAVAENLLLNFGQEVQLYQHWRDMWSAVSILESKESLAASLQEIIEMESDKPQLHICSVNEKQYILIANGDKYYICPVQSENGEHVWKEDSLFYWDDTPLAEMRKGELRVVSTSQDALAAISQTPESSTMKIRDIKAEQQKETANQNYSIIKKERVNTLNEALEDLVTHDYAHDTVHLISVRTGHHVVVVNRDEGKLHKCEVSFQESVNTVWKSDGVLYIDQILPALSWEAGGVKAYTDELVKRAKVGECGFEAIDIQSIADQKALKEMREKWPTVQTLSDEKALAGYLERIIALQDGNQQLFCCSGDKPHIVISKQNRELLICPVHEKQGNHVWKDRDNTFYWNEIPLAQLREGGLDLTPQTQKAAVAIDQAKGSDSVIVRDIAKENALKADNAHIHVTKLLDQDSLTDGLHAAQELGFAEDRIVLFTTPDAHYAVVINSEGMLHHSKVNADEGKHLWGVNNTLYIDRFTPVLSLEGAGEAYTEKLIQHAKDGEYDFTTVDINEEAQFMWPGLDIKGAFSSVEEGVKAIRTQHPGSDTGIGRFPVTLTTYLFVKVGDKLYTGEIKQDSSETVGFSTDGQQCYYNGTPIAHMNGTLTATAEARRLIPQAIADGKMKEHQLQPALWEIIESAVILKGSDGGEASILLSPEPEELRIYQAESGLTYVSSNREEMLLTHEITQDEIDEIIADATGISGDTTLTLDDLTTTLSKFEDAAEANEKLDKGEYGQSDDGLFCFLMTGQGIVTIPIEEKPTMHCCHFSDGKLEYTSSAGSTLDLDDYPEDIANDFNSATSEGACAATYDPSAEYSSIEEATNHLASFSYAPSSDGKSLFVKGEREIAQVPISQSGGGEGKVDSPKPGKYYYTTKGGESIELIDPSDFKKVVQDFLGLRSSDSRRSSMFELPRDGALPAIDVKRITGIDSITQAKRKLKAGQYTVCFNEHSHKKVVYATRTGKVHAVGVYNKRHSSGDGPYVLSNRGNLTYYTGPRDKRGTDFETWLSTQ